MQCKRNYYALTIAILARKTVAQALTDMDINYHEKNYEYKPRKRKYNITEEEIKTAIELKKNGQKWEEIEEELGYPKQVIFQRVKRYMGKGWKNRDW